MDHKSLARQARSDHSSRIRDRRGESPSDAASDRAMISRAFKEHDDQLHGGKKTRLHLRDGGCAEGSANAARLDRPGRARGGPLGLGSGGGKKKSNKSGKGNHVNVIVASGGGEKERPVPVPVPAAGAPPPRPPMPPPGAGPAGPGGPPMGGPPMGGPPMPGGGGPPGMPPRPPGMMRADGGKTVAFHMKAGAAGGAGRLAKAKMPIPDENAAD